MGAIKLTLTVQKESLPYVKSYAKKQHTSVSKLVQGLFDEIMEKEKIQPDPIMDKYKDIEIPQWIKNLTIEVKYDDKDMSDDEVKYEYLKEKYGL